MLCQKVFPPLFDREFICPTLYDRDSRFSPPSKNISDIRVDEKEMASVVSPDVSIAVGIVKRHSDGSYTIRYIGKNASTQPVETFKVGDRVQFNRTINDRGMRTWLGTENSIITKMNKVTATVKTQTAAWKMNIDELHQYVDPFSGWDVAE